MKIQTKWLERDRFLSNSTWVFREEKLDTGERKSSHGPGSDTTCVTPWIVRRCAKATASQGTHYILDNIATYRQRWNLLNNAVVVVIGKERLLTWVENYTSLCYIHFYSTLICNDQRISFLIYIYIYQKFAKLSRTIGKSLFTCCLFPSDFMTPVFTLSRVSLAIFIWRN